MFKRQKDAYLAQDRLIWPYSGNPLDACRSMLTELEAAERAVEEQRAAMRM
jgi:hypothetical protein